MTKINTILEKIANGNNSTFKELYGNDTNVLKEQAERYKKLIHQFKEKFRHESVELFSSPGRTEIGGNHTDHNNGRVLAGAVNLDNIAVVAPNNSNVINIQSVGYPEFKVSLEDMKIEEDAFFSSASLVKGICARMKEQGYTIGGFDACIEGRVPKGSGLSSSASFEVLIGAIVSHLFNDGKLDPVQNAIIGQWSENNYFGKPCGLMDQTACSVGGFITIDFADTAKPIVKAIDFDFGKTGYTLVITDTGGNHADLNADYAALPTEMKSVASELGKTVLREVSLNEVVENIPALRQKTNDRAILRAIHFQNENERVVGQVNALENNEFKAFLKLINESGYSSYMYNQNIFTSSNVEEQGVSLGLALSDMILHDKGAWRVHGGGFAGTIQAFVPNDLLDKYVETLESVFGKGKCHKLFIRSKGSVKVEL